MIVGENFAFLHIPKCGGTSIRTALAPWDRYENAFWGRSAEADGFPLDLAHMTPAVLRARRPEVFVEVDRLPRYAILRDPADRLISSVNEYLENVHKTSIARTPPKTLRSLIAALEQELGAQSGALPADLVHFTPQSRYVTLDGARYVENLYRLDDLDRFRDDLNRDCKTQVESFGQLRAKEGRGVKLRVPEHFVWRANRLVWSYMPRPVHTAVKTAGKALLASKTGTNTAEAFRASDTFRRFLDRFYAEDQALWQEACAG